MTDAKAHGRSQVNVGPADQDLNEHRSDPDTLPIRRAIGDFLIYAIQTIELTALTETGASAIILIQKVISGALDRGSISVDPEMSLEESSALLKSTEQWSGLANTEIERGFPLLNRHALMGIWGALEAMIDDVSTHWLHLHPEKMAAKDFPKVQVQLNTFMTLEPLEQKRLVVEELKRTQGSTLRIGAAQFEGVLNSIGLGGAIDRNVKSVLRIAKSFRNAVAHRGGKVDDRVLADLPDLELIIGQPIRISREQIISMISAMCTYSEIIHDRVRIASGLPPTGWEKASKMVPLSELMDPFRPRADH